VESEVMFWKKRTYPRLTAADEMIIETLKMKRAAASKAFDRYERLKRSGEDIRAQAKAEWLAANDREKLAEAAYDEMMERLVAEARAAIAKAESSQ
jgi:hypothetical protein